MLHGVIQVSQVLVYTLTRFTRVFLLLEILSLFLTKKGSRKKGEDIFQSYTICVEMCKSHLNQDVFCKPSSQKGESAYHCQERKQKVVRTIYLISLWEK